MRKRLQRASGFTLIEMMVVVTILSIITLLAAAGYGQLSQRAALQSASFDLQSSLSWARSRALENGSDVWVIIYPEGGRDPGEPLKGVAMGKSGAYYVYEDRTMRFARAGEPTFGYDDFNPADQYAAPITDGQLLEFRYLEDYRGGAIRFARMGGTVFDPPFNMVAPVACSVCVGGQRGAIVFTGDGMVRFYDGAGTLLADVNDASLALGNVDEGRGYIFAIARATAHVAAKASY